MNNDSPFFSVIVVALNAEQMILKTIESVLKQTCDDYEIIVKDGCSKDRTVTILPNHNKMSVRVCAEKSVYDAMNQATELTKGKDVIYLNCGDLLIDASILDKVKVFLVKDTGIEIAYGGYVRDDLGLIRQKQITKAFVGAGTVLDKLVAYKEDKRMDNVGLMPYQDKDDLIYSLNAGNVHWCATAKGIKKVSEDTYIAHNLTEQLAA